MENINQLVTKYIYLFAITSLFFPLFMLFSWFAMTSNPSNLFLPFLIANILFLAIPYLIRKKSHGVWEKILNIIFIIIIPQGFALFVLKPYGFIEMFIGQLFCMALYIHSYMIYDKEEVSISLGAMLAGLWFIIILGALSSFMNIPKIIISQYTTYSIIFLASGIYLSNRVNLENLISRRYRRLNSVSASLTFINLFMSIAFVVIVLLLFKFKGLAPIIVSFIVEIIKFIFRIIKKVIDFLNSLLGTKSTYQDSNANLNDLLKNMKPTKKSLFATILDIIGYILAIGICAYIFYKLLGLVKVVIKDIINRMAEFLSRITQNYSAVERGSNYTDVKTFIFAQAKQKSKKQLTKIKKPNWGKISDLNTRLRLMFKFTMEFFYQKRNYNLKPTQTPLEMGNLITKGELINNNIISQLIEEYSKVRYNKNYHVKKIEQFEEFVNKLK